MLRPKRRNEKSLTHISIFSKTEIEHKNLICFFISELKMETPQEESGLLTGAPSSSKGQKNSLRVSISFKFAPGSKGTKSRDFPGRHFSLRDRDLLQGWAHQFRSGVPLQIEERDTRYIDLPDTDPGAKRRKPFIGISKVSRADAYHWFRMTQIRLAQKFAISKIPEFPLPLIKSFRPDVYVQGQAFNFVDVEWAESGELELIQKHKQEGVASKLRDPVPPCSVTRMRFGEVEVLVHMMYKGGGAFFDAGEILPGRYDFGKTSLTIKPSSKLSSSRKRKRKRKVEECAVSDSPKNSLESHEVAENSMNSAAAFSVVVASSNAKAPRRLETDQKLSDIPQILDKYASPTTSFDDLLTTAVKGVPVLGNFDNAMLNSSEIPRIHALTHGSAARGWTVVNFEPAVVVLPLRNYEELKLMYVDVTITASWNQDGLTNDESQTLSPKSIFFGDTLVNVHRIEQDKYVFLASLVPAGEYIIDGVYFSLRYEEFD